MTGAARHEAGTPNLLGAVALGAVCDALEDADRAALQRAEQVLLRRMRDGLAALPGVVELRLFAADHPRVGIVSFAVSGLASAEVATRLARDHRIGVRDGLSCAHPFAQRLLADATRRVTGPLPATAVRASIGLGSSARHVDQLVAALAEITGVGHDHHPPPAADGV